MKRSILVILLGLLMILYATFFNDSFYNMISAILCIGEYYLLLKILFCIVFSFIFTILIYYIYKHKVYKARTGVMLTLWLFSLCFLIMPLQTGYDMLSLLPICIAIIVTIIYIKKSSSGKVVVIKKTSLPQTTISIAIIIVIFVIFIWFEFRDFANSMIIDNEIDLLQNTNFGIDKLIFYIISCTVLIISVYLFKINNVVSYITVYVLGVPLMLSLYEIRRSLIILTDINDSNGLNKISYNIASHLGIFVILSIFLMLYIYKTEKIYENSLK